MDYGKVQQERRQDLRRKQRSRFAAILFFCALAATVVPLIRREVKKEELQANATEFLSLLQAGDVDLAWARGLKKSLREQHDISEFSGIIQHLHDVKGKLNTWELTRYASQPDGKPYEYLVYRLNLDRGLATLHLALQLEEDTYKAKAYRLEALGL